MDRQEIDRRLRSDLHRWSMIGGAASGTLLLLAALLVVIGGPSLGSLGLAGLAVVLSLPMLDAAVRLPRPSPRVADASVVVPSSRLVGVIVLLAGLMLSLLAVGLLTSDVSGQRGQWVRYVVPLLAGTLIVFGALTTARPTRLVVSRAEVALTGVRSRSIAWDAIDSIAPADDAVAGSGSSALSLTVRGAGTRIDLLTRWTRPTLWVLIAWLEHYRRHPVDRIELDGPAALARLHDLDARLQDASLRPAWFRGPGPA